MKSWLGRLRDAFRTNSELWGMVEAQHQELCALRELHAKDQTVIVAMSDAFNILQERYDHQRYKHTQDLAILLTASGGEIHTTRELFEGVGNFDGSFEVKVDDLPDNEVLIKLIATPNEQGKEGATQ